MSLVYPAWRQLIGEWILAKQVPADLVFCVIGVNGDYVPLALHDTLDDVPEDARISGETQMTSLSVVDGKLKSENVSFTDLIPNEQLAGILIYAKYGVSTRLVAFMNTAADNSLPVNLTTNRGFVHFDPTGIFIF